MFDEGEEDTAYVNFFGIDGKAAMIACDRHGVVPSDLLYLPKYLFDEDAEGSKKLAAVKYVMMERARQSSLRKLLSEKNRILSYEDVDQLWRQRQRDGIDKEPLPKFSKKQLAEAERELDTESEDDTYVDEKGLIKPPPPPPPPQPQQQKQQPQQESQPTQESQPQQQDPQQAQEATAQEAAAGTVIAEDTPLITGKDEAAEAPAPVVTGGEDDAKVEVELDDAPLQKEETLVPQPPPPPPQPPVVESEGVKANVAVAESVEPYDSNPQEQSSKEFLDKIVSTYSNWSEQRNRKESIAKPPGAPPLPPIARFPRTLDGITAEELDVLESQRQFAIYAREAPVEAKKFRQSREAALRKAMLAQMAEREERRQQGRQFDADGTEYTATAADTNPDAYADTVAEADAAPEDGAPNEHTSRSPPRSNSSHSFSESSSSSYSDGYDPNDPHERQLEAIRRVALLRVNLSESNFKKGRKIDYEMDNFPQMGTVAHTIKSKALIGKRMPVAKRIAHDRTREEAFTKSLRETLDTQNSRDLRLTKRMKKADVVIEREKNRNKGLTKVVNETKSEISARRREMADRQQQRHLARNLSRSARKHRYARRYNEDHATNGDLKRYEHDQEEMLRRDLKEMIGVMDMQKNWDKDAIVDI